MDNLPKDNQDEENKKTEVKPIGIGELDSQQPSPSTDTPNQPSEEKLEEKKEEEKVTIPKDAPEPEPEIKEEEPIQTNVQQAANAEEIPPPEPPKKGKSKIKTISTIMGLIIIIIALPLGVFLVKQRQEIRKEAEEEPGLSGSVSFCGITISPTGDNWSNGVYTLYYSITSNDGQQHTVEVHTYGCSCVEGSRGSCGTNSGKCSGNSFTTKTNYNGSVSSPNIGDCGTHQNDVFVVSVDGDTSCSNN